jgi:hypothetical protein
MSITTCLALSLLSHTPSSNSFFSSFLSFLVSFSVDTPEGNILLDGYVTGPTAAQWMADSAEGAAPPAAGTAAAGAVCRDGDRALNPETGLPSKTGICSATALANSLVEQAKFASSALHLNNAGDAMAWGWQVRSATATEAM